VAGLPVVDDAGRVLADQPRLELLDGRRARLGAPLQDRLAEPDDALVGVDLQEEPTRLDEEGLEPGDTQRLGAEPAGRVEGGRSWCAHRRILPAKTRRSGFRKPPPRSPATAPRSLLGPPPAVRPSSPPRAPTAGSAAARRGAGSRCRTAAC